jgi:hypothetical protein
MPITAVVFTGRGLHVVSSLEELAAVLSEVEGEAYVVLIEGRVVGTAKVGLEKTRGSTTPTPSTGIAEGQGSRVEEQRIEVPERRGIAVVLDQMFRGFAEIVAREISDPSVELHEVVGRGLERSIKVGRIYKEPAKDDFDVLSLVERLADGGKLVVFFTGDKKLANQAMALGRSDVVVHYMPPNEFPGKESLAKVMIERVKEALKTSKR